MGDFLHPDIQHFIEDSRIINMINIGDFKQIYQKEIPYAQFDNLNRQEFTGAFTEAMLSADINPLSSMNLIPPNYLYESDIEAFIIPEHIHSVGYSAFDSCYRLKHITLHKNIKFVDEYAFYSCDQLTSIDIQNPSCEIKSFGFPKFIPVVRYNGNLDQWRDFITKNSLEFLECNWLELIDREIFQYNIEKIN